VHDDNKKDNVENARNADNFNRFIG